MLVKTDRRRIPRLPANLLIDLRYGGDERLAEIAVGHEMEFPEAELLRHEPIGDRLELARKMVHVAGEGIAGPGMLEVDPDRVVAAVDEGVGFEGLTIFGKAGARRREKAFDATIVGTMMGGKAHAEIDSVGVEDPKVRAAIGRLRAAIGIAVSLNELGGPEQLIGERVPARAMRQGPGERARALAVRRRHEAQHVGRLLGEDRQSERQRLLVGVEDRFIASDIAKDGFDEALVSGMVGVDQGISGILRVGDRSLLLDRPLCAPDRP